MTVQDARTPASNQPEAGKSIGWHKGYVEGSRPDLRVPVRQVHLTNGKDVTLYEYPGEDHRFGRAWPRFMHRAVTFLHARLD